MEDMPKLYDCRIDYFQPCLEALIKSQVGRFIFTQVGGNQYFLPNLYNCIIVAIILKKDLYNEDNEMLLVQQVLLIEKQMKLGLQIDFFHLISGEIQSSN